MGVGYTDSSAVARVSWLLVAALLALTCLTGVGVHQIASGSIPGYVVVTLLHGALYLGAVVLVLRGKASPWDFALILLGAVVLRLVAVWAPHEVITTDALRYVWDGRIQWDGWSPYLYAPAAPELEHLRDSEIYPNINQKERATTVYPPFAQFLFLVGYLISDSVAGQKVVMLGMEAISVAALIGCLSAWGLPRERVILYAWHPLPIWEFVSQAHLDAAAVAFLLLGLWAVLRQRQGLAGGLFALAALVKYFPVVVLPALWRRWDWRMPVVFVVVAALLYWPHVSVAGTKVIGFLAQHLDNEGYRAGWGFHVVWMLRDFQLADPPGRLYVAAALVILAGLAAIAFFMRGRDTCQPAMLVALAAAFVWLTSPHYPWYFGWIVPLLCLYVSPSALLMTLTCFVLYWPRPPGGATWTELYAIVYYAPLALAVGLWLWTRVRRSRA
ncbi:MAG: glycosyltransferase family 87 protein [Pseudomonadota bacterium]